MSLKVINLEQGLPTSDAAIRRLTYEMHAARTLGFQALKLIHGYGSSGKGGRIRQEARLYLERQTKKGLLRMIVWGERFSIFDEDTRLLLAACPELRRDDDLERHNNGVTFVLL